jgi:hypothetical protein
MRYKMTEYQKQEKCADCGDSVSVLCCVINKVKDIETKKIITVKRWVCLRCFDKYSWEEKFFKK